MSVVDWGRDTGICMKNEKKKMIKIAIDRVRKIFVNNEMTSSLW